MKIKEAGPSSSKHELPANPSCAHSRMVEEERTSDGKESGRLVCRECGAVLPPAAPPNTSTD